MTRASIDRVLQAIQDSRAGQSRTLVGIAGPPGSGKSTLASNLASHLGSEAAVLPMDGYHLDNEALDLRGLLHRKGAPETFDSAAFVQLVRTLCGQDSVSYPIFDRGADRSIPDGGQISEATRIVLIEGNYLLLSTPPWHELKALFDLTVYLDVPREVLRSRLVRRWRDHGLSPSQAEARADGNDMINVELVQASSELATLTVRDDEQ